MTTQNSQAVEAANIRVVEKTNCFVVHEGNEVAGSFAGPEAKERAEMFADALRASLASPLEVAAPVGDDLRARCVEIIQWQDTGILTGNALRALADQIGEDDGGHSLQRAESKTAREALEIVAASRVPVASPAVPIKVTDAMVETYLTANDDYWARTDQMPDKNPSKWRQGTPKEATRESLNAVFALLATPPVGAGGSVGTSRNYTDAQLAAGVAALEFCRSRGIQLSDETVAGIVYDHMTAATPKPPFTIYMDEDPIDVEQFYRAKGFEKLPATPTMTGQEIRDCGWKKQHDNQMFIDHGNTGKQFQPIGTTEAVILVNGMRFVSIPAATWGGGR